LRKWVFWGCCTVGLGNFILKFWRRILPSSTELWVCEWTHNPEDEGGTFLQNFRMKLPNHTVQQPRRCDSSTITWWKTQITVFMLLRIYENLFLITLSLSFIVFFDSWLIF
jgi:hypothetical protein